jgi:hypothetical protein
MSARESEHVIAIVSAAWYHMNRQRTLPRNAGDQWHEWIYELALRQHPSALAAVVCNIHG